MEGMRLARACGGAIGVGGDGSAPGSGRRAGAAGGGSLPAIGGGAAPGELRRVAPAPWWGQSSASAPARLDFTVSTQLQHYPAAGSVSAADNDAEADRHPVPRRGAAQAFMGPALERRLWPGRTHALRVAHRRSRRERASSAHVVRRPSCRFLRQGPACGASSRSDPTSTSLVELRLARRPAARRRSSDPDRRAPGAMPRSPGAAGPPSGQPPTCWAPGRRTARRRSPYPRRRRDTAPRAAGDAPDRRAWRATTPRGKRQRSRMRWDRQATWPTEMRVDLGAVQRRGVRQRQGRV